MSLLRGLCDPLHFREGQCFHEASEVLGLCPQDFLGFTQALAFPVGYNESYISLGRDILYINM